MTTTTRDPVLLPASDPKRTRLELEMLVGQRVTIETRARWQVTGVLELLPKTHQPRFCRVSTDCEYRGSVAPVVFTMALVASVRAAD